MQTGQPALAIRGAARVWVHQWPRRADRGKEESMSEGGASRGRSPPVLAEGQVTLEKEDTASTKGSLMTAQMAVPAASSAAAFHTICGRRRTQVRCLLGERGEHCLLNGCGSLIAAPMTVALAGSGACTRCCADGAAAATYAVTTCTQREALACRVVGSWRCLSPPSSLSSLSSSPSSSPPSSACGSPPAKWCLAHARGLLSFARPCRAACTAGTHVPSRGGCGSAALSLCCAAQARCMRAVERADLPACLSEQTDRGINAVQLHACSKLKRRSGPHEARCLGAAPTALEGRGAAGPHSRSSLMSAETAGSTSTVMRAPWLAWRRRCSALTTRRFSTIHLPRARRPLTACLETATSQQIVSPACGIMRLCVHRGAPRTTSPCGSAAL